MADEVGEHWHIRMLELAEFISKWSKDPSTKVGCVIACGKHVMSSGYNGLPKNMKDDNRIFNRDFKLAHTVHAEVNALESFHLWSRIDANRCSIYLWPFMPCVSCAECVKKSGIKTCYAPDVMVERWKASCAEARQVLADGGVELKLISDPAIVERAMASFKHT